jgi:hypothetical protein
VTTGSFQSMRASRDAVLKETSDADRISMSTLVQAFPHPDPPKKSLPGDHPMTHRPTKALIQAVALRTKPLDPLPHQHQETTRALSHGLSHGLRIGPSHGRIGRGGSSRPLRDSGRPTPCICPWSCSDGGAPGSRLYPGKPALRIRGRPNTTL